MKKAIARLVIFLKFLVRNSFEHDIFTRSAALAYYFIFAIFPSILFLYSMLGFFAIDWSTIFDSTKSFLPNDVYKVIQGYIELLTPKQNLLFLLTGLITAMYSSYKAVKCIKKGLNLAYGTRKKRTMFQESIRSLILTFLLYVCILLSLLVFPIVSSIMDLFYKYKWLLWLENIKDFLLVVPFFICLSVLYYLSPYKRAPIIVAISGSFFSTLMIILSSRIFNVFTINAFRYSSTYGSLATIVFFILWLYFVALIILIGGEASAFLINKSFNSPSTKNEGDHYEIP